ncbi:hypothetical protein ACE6H2_020644 [Prunus campanulata]
MITIPLNTIRTWNYKNKSRALSSIGASYAGVYVMQKRQKEKMEKKEDENRGKGESSTAKESKVSAPGRTKKVHAENFRAPDATRP